MRLYKRGEVWWIEYQQCGKQTRISTKLRNKKLAKSVLQSMRLAALKTLPLDDILNAVRRIYGQAEVVPTGTPLESAWEMYQQTAEATGRGGLSEDAAIRRKRRYANLCEWIAKNRPAVQTIEAVSGVVAAAYAADLANGRKSKTRINIISDLSAIWRTLAHAADSITINPWSSLRPRDTDSERGEPFTPAQESAILDAAKRIGKDWLGACLIARCTGLRYGDVAQLEWSAVDLERGVIDLQPNKTKRHGIRVLIPIAPALAEWLRERKQSAGDNSFVLPVHAAAYDREAYKKRHLAFAEVLQAAKVDAKKYTFHSWRHTFRTRLAEAGVARETAMILCGHTDEQTSARYDHSKHLAELQDAIGKAFGGKPAGKPGTVKKQRKRRQVDNLPLK